MSKQLVVGHSEATLGVNTVEFRGVQVDEFPGVKVEIRDGTNPIDGQWVVGAKPKEAMRFTEGKLRFDLLPIEALIELTRVYDMGALKYDDDNWRKGMSWRKVYRPIFSHLFKWMSGQAVDSETGCHHLAMVAWNALTLLVYEIRKLGTDDRVKFSIDENFNWVDNHLGLGLSPEKIAELKEKYKQQREKAKG